MDRFCTDNSLQTYTILCYLYLVALTTSSKPYRRGQHEGRRQLVRDQLVAGMQAQFVREKCEYISISKINMVYKQQTLATGREEVYALLLNRYDLIGSSTAPNLLFYPSIKERSVHPPVVAKASCFSCCSCSEPVWLLRQLSVILLPRWVPPEVSTPLKRLPVAWVLSSIPSAAMRLPCTFNLYRVAEDESS